MTTITRATVVEHVASEVRRLIGTGSGPTKMKTRLADWSQLVQRRAPEAWQSPALNGAAEALLILGHANASFRLGPTQADAGRPTILVSDAGGYFAAQDILKEIVANAPICPECRAELIAHVATVLDRLAAQLECLLTRA